VHGHLGNSLQTGAPVTQILRQRIGATLELILLGTFFATIYGGGLGVLVAKSRLLRGLPRILVNAGMAVPDFVLGLVLIYFIYFRLRWAPAPIGQVGILAQLPPHITGAVAFDSLITGHWGTFGSALGHLVLPVATLALIYGSPIARIAAVRMQETERMEYIEYARLCGLPRWRVFRYELRSVGAAVTTSSAVTLGYLLGGAVLVEIVFNWGGLGQFAAQSILANDVPAIQGFVLVAGVFSLLIYFLLETTYGLIDPRVR
jgi:ABC-type dipeptide/oligopeptide/nickel transport system permease component